VIYLTVIAVAELFLIGALVYDRRKSSSDFIALVDRLCQRVQSPAAAVLEHDERMRERHGEEYAPPALEPDDDEAYWLSRDRLAESAMKAELSERDS
jgi:hypothetical protein